MSDRPTTALCTSTPEDIHLRGRSLSKEILGKVSFTEAMFRHVLGRDPSPAQTALLDASLIALMEHGLTPTAVSARLTYTSAPEAMQGAVAAGLLGVGSLFVGTLEGCGHLLARIVAAEDGEAEARAIVREHRETHARIPGFGHPIHHPVDPRTPVLLRLATDHGTHGAHCEALGLLGAAIEAERGRPLPANATGAVAAVLADCGVPVEILRGFALISRAAGLVAHIHEEQHDPTLRALWAAAEDAVPPKENP